MNKIILIIFALFVASCASQNGPATTPSDEQILQLKAELDQILYSDQILRRMWTPDMTEERRSEILAEFGYGKEDFDKLGWKIVEKQDSLNLVRVEAIIEKHGYPGKSLVGTPTNTSAYYVIQHSDKLEKYFPLIEQAGKDKEISQRLVAMMHDRLLMYQGKEQIYGTQIKGQMITNKEKNTQEWFQFLWPVADPATVNERRKEVGFSETLEEYVVSMGLEYKPYTMEEIKEITGK